MTHNHAVTGVTAKAFHVEFVVDTAAMVQDFLQ